MCGEFCAMKISSFALRASEDKSSEALEKEAGS
jgi:hypothetical protein